MVDRWVGDGVFRGCGLGWASVSHADQTDCLALWTQPILQAGAAIAHLTTVIE